MMGVSKLDLLSIVFGFLFLCLLALLVVVSVYHRKDTIKSLWSLFIEAITPRFSRSFLLLFPVWALVKIIDLIFRLNIFSAESGDLSEEPYQSHRNQYFNFAQGQKTVLIKGDMISIKKQLEEFIKDFNIEGFTNEFLLKIEGADTVLQCPPCISFTDYCLMIQSLDSESKKMKPTGFFRSDEISFYAYQDTATLHNLIGKTSKGDYFSIFTLDDLGEGARLRMNNKIIVEDRAEDHHFIKAYFEHHQPILMN